MQDLSGRLTRLGDLLLEMTSQFMPALTQVSAPPRSPASASRPEVLSLADEGKTQKCRYPQGGLVAPKGWWSKPWSY